MLGFPWIPLLLWPVLPGPQAMAPAATGTLAALVQAETSPSLGRRNPFQPLVGLHGVASRALPTIPGPPKAPGESHLAPAPEVRYLGSASDAEDAVAAARIGARTVFLRQGDRVAGATLIGIYPDRLVWRRERRTYSTPLSRPAGAR